MLARQPGSVCCLALGIALVIGCAHADEASAPAPAEAEAPATAISVLLAQRTDLALTPRQADQLQALDHELQVLNGPLEAKLAQFDRARAAAGEDARTPAGLGAARGMGPGGGGRMGGGRLGGGGMSRGRGLGGGRSGGPPVGRLAPGRTGGPDGKAAAEEEAVHAKMFQHHATALRAAFDILNPAQRQRALQLLGDNGYDPPDDDPAANAGAHDVPVRPGK